MKLIRKSSSVFIQAVLCVGLFVSCNELKSAFSSGIDFSKSEETAKLNELLNKHITEGMVVQRIGFDYSNSSHGFSFHKDGARIVYIDATDNTVVHGIKVDLKTGEFGPDEWLEAHPSSIKREQKGVPIKNFDFSKIGEIVNAAILVLNEEDILPNGIGTFDIEFSSGIPDSYKYDFKIQNRKGSSTQGKTTRISYDEYHFKADKDGNLEYK